MNILGISAYYHDSAVALLRDSEIIAAAQEERFSRKKHDARFPINAIKYCGAVVSYNRVSGELTPYMFPRMAADSDKDDFLWKLCGMETLVLQLKLYLNGILGANPHEPQAHKGA